MQVVILAGGLGTRLGAITKSMPKPMVDVGGRPFLKYILNWLAKCGFTRILLLLGYLGGQIQEYFGNGSSLGLDIEYAWEHNPLGTAGAIRNACGQLDPQFLLLYGDSYLPIDYREVASQFQSQNEMGLVVVYDNSAGDTNVPNNISLDKDGFVLRYDKEHNSSDLRYVEAGALCLTRVIFEKLPAALAISLEKDIYPHLVASRQLRAFITKQRFYDIGTPSRLEEFASTV
jgi:NDP-sugar pyrophosphorylase family protein